MHEPNGAARGPLSRKYAQAMRSYPSGPEQIEPESSLASAFVRFRRSSAYLGPPLQGGGRWFDPTSAHRGVYASHGSSVSSDGVEATLSSRGLRTDSAGSPPERHHARAFGERYLPGRSLRARLRGQTMGTLRGCRPPNMASRPPRVTIRAGSRFRGSRPGRSGSSWAGREASRCRRTAPGSCSSAPPPGTTS